MLSLLAAGVLLAGAIIGLAPEVHAAESPVLYHCKCGNKHSTALENGTESWKPGTTKCYAACDGTILEWTAFDPTQGTFQPGNYYLVDNSTQDNATNRSKTLELGTASISGTFNIDMNGLDYRTINTSNFFTAIKVGYNSTLNLCNTKVSGGTVYSMGPDGAHSGVMLLSNYHTANQTTDQTATVNLFGVNLERQAGTNTVTHAGAVKVTGSCTLNVYASSIKGGAVTESGGSILVENGGRVVLAHSTVSGGSAVSGGNIYVNSGGTLEVTGGTITGGYASGNGGNIVLSNDTYASFSGTKITGGVAGNNGGNLWAGSADKDIYGNLLLADCTVSGGQATGAVTNGGTGGNIVTARRTAINGGTVSGGQATNRAGNILINDAEVIIQAGAQVTGGTSGQSDGGNIYITGANGNGKLTMHDTAVVKGGVSGTNGGNIYLNKGSLSVGGQSGVTSGRAANGGNIYAASGTTATVSGSAYLAGGGYTGVYGSGTAVARAGGNVYIASGATFTMDGTTQVRNSMAISGAESGNFCVYGTLQISGQAQVFGGICGSGQRNIHLAGGTLKISGQAKVDGGVTCDSGSLILSGTPQVAIYRDERTDKELYLSENVTLDAVGLSSGANIRLSHMEATERILTTAQPPELETARSCFSVQQTGDLVGWAVTRERDAQGNANLWLRSYTPQAQVVIAGEGGYDYETFAAAADVAAGTQTVKLLADVQDISVPGQTLCLDLNGYNVTGTLTAATLKGADSATRLYGQGVDGRADNTYGVINTITEGTVVEPFYQYQDGTNLRKYMAVSDAQGTSFHRYYMAITQVSIAPKTAAFAYEAAFLGDSAVKAAADAGTIQYGMYFKATSEMHVSASKAFVAGPYGETNLRYNYLQVSVQNVLKEGADNDTRASMPIYAKAYITSGGQTDYSTEAVRSFNDVLKNANDVFLELENQTLQDILVHMYRSFSDGMTTWTNENVGNIRGAAKTNCECGSDSYTHMGDCPGTPLTWQPWDGTEKTGNFYLTEDKTTPLTINTDTRDVKLDLRGHDILVTDLRAINMGAGKLTICDSEGGGSIIGYGQGGTSLNAATINQWGGQITLYGVDVSVYDGGNSIQNGGAVYLSGEGTSFRMYDGDLTGCALPVGQEEDEYAGHGGTIYIGSGATAVLHDVDVTGGTAWGGGNIYLNKNASLTLSGNTTVTDGYDYAQSSNIYSFGDLIIKDQVNISGGLWNSSSGSQPTNRNLRVQGSNATLTMTDQSAIDGGVTVSNAKAVTLSGTPRICYLDENGEPYQDNSNTRHLRLIGTPVIDAAGLEKGALIYVGTDSSGTVFATVSADAGDWITDCFAGSESVFGGPAVRTDDTHLAMYTSEYLYHCVCASGTDTHMDGCSGQKLLWQKFDDAAQALLATENITGNYYLTENRTSPIVLDHADADLKLDLRGFDIKVESGRAINMGSGKLAICDSVGGSELIGYGQGGSSLQGAVIRQWNGELSLYGVDVSVYNGGNGITSGGAAYIQGEEASFTFRMCNGTMTGCEATGNGGVLAVGGGKPNLRLQNVSITDGSCPGKGQSVYLGACTTWLDGMIRIDSMFMLQSAKLTIADTFLDDLSDIRINMDAAGTVAAVTRDHTGAIKSDLEGCKMVYENGKLVLQAGTEYIYHCLCGNKIYHADGTLRRQNRDSCYSDCDGTMQTWSPWDGDVRSGYFYLLSNRTDAIALASASVNMRLDLRGIDVAVPDARAINLGSGTITVCDSIGGGTIMGYGHEASVNSASILQWGGKLTLYGVDVAVYNGGNSIKNGGTVYVYNEAAQFNMYGGSITGTSVTGRAGTMAIVQNAQAYLESVTTVAGISGEGFGDDIYLNNAELTIGGTANIRDIYLGKGDTTALHIGSGLDLTDGRVGISLEDKTKTVATDVAKNPTKVICSTDTSYALRYDADAGTLTLDGAQILVGFGRRDITPSETGIPMGGYGNSENRLSETIDTYRLYYTCIAITDEKDETLLIFTADVISPSTKWAPQAREAVSAATGVPVDNIVIACTHQHSSPDSSLDGYEAVAQWNEDMVTWAVEAAQDALADRSPAQMSVASTTTNKLNFVRHYILSDGQYAGDNHNHMIEGTTWEQHATEADNEMQMLKFTRETGKDIWLVNWQTHPHRAGGGTKYLMTSDVVGVFRDEMETALDCYFAYFSGASGNINTVSRVSGNNITKDYIETGQALAATALAAQNSFTSVDVGLVGATKLTFNGKLKTYSDSEIASAQQVWDKWSTVCSVNEGSHRYGKTNCPECTVPFGMSLTPLMYSPFHANAILTWNTYLRNMDTRSFDIWALSVGDIGFAVVPYEMFDTNGLYVKENSPFDMTFVLTQANYANGYIPSAAAYEYGCYEADTTKYVSGSGEILADMFVDMLTELREVS